MRRGIVLGLLLLACSRAASEPAERGSQAAPKASSDTLPQRKGAARPSAPLPARPEPPLDEYRLPAPERLVAIGDLHGDINATRDVLRLAGAIDGADKWIGGGLVLVQTGDLLDRGDTERQILSLLQSIQEQALAAGGRVVILNGNHETMNVAGDFRYVTQRGFEAFASAAQSEGDPVMTKAQGRAAAFRPGGPVAKSLASHPVAIVVGDTVFAHGGVLATHVDYGLARLNRETTAWFEGRAPAVRALSVPDAPVWTRLFSEDQVAPAACAQLGEVLRRLGVKRMVVGHTVKPKIDTACEEQVWRIDVGMSAYYGGKQVQALEIAAGKVRVLSAPKSSTDLPPASK